MASILQFAVKQACHKNFRPMRLMASNVAFGATHWWCPKCGIFRGPSLHKLCCWCRTDNLYHFLFKDDEEKEVQEESS